VVVDVSLDVDGDGDVDMAGKPRTVHADTCRMLTFQRLDVYQRAIEFLSLAYEVVTDAARPWSAPLRSM
jgi:hypothetical protein